MNAPDAGVWPIAGATAPKVKPPANAAPPFRNSLRAGRFEPMGLSFADEPTRESLPRSRKYTPVSGSNRAQSGVPLDLACHASQHCVELSDDCTPKKIRPGQKSFMKADGSEKRQLTDSLWEDSMPRFVPSTGRVT